jgi:hypothetical protein
MKKRDFLFPRLGPEAVLNCTRRNRVHADRKRELSRSECRRWRRRLKGVLLSGQKDYEAL